MRKIVLENDDPFVPLLVERKAGETQLFVKQVKAEGVRYVVCRNEAEAENDRKDREAIVAVLDARLRKGDKALIGNSAYRRYLRKAGTRGERSFEINGGKLAEDARFDGIFVLRTHAKVTPLQAVLRYRDLLIVEDLFRRTKALMCTRPIRASIPRRRHPRPCLLLLPGAVDTEASRRPRPPRPALRRMEGAVARSHSTASNRCASITRGADWLARTDAAPDVTRLFKCAHVALPSGARQTGPQRPLPSKSARKRRGRPRGSAAPTLNFVGTPT